MTTVSQIKEYYQLKSSELLAKYNVFFAFSNNQFDEGLKACNLAEGEKVTRWADLCMYAPSKYADQVDEGLKAITKEQTDLLSSPKWRVKYIKYELSNHEAYYVGDIEDTLEALGAGFAYDEVLAIYKEQLQYQD